VIDCDVHQGNGTAAIFRADPTVFTFSIHGEKNFPLRKEQSTLDVAVPNGTGDDAYLRLLEDYLPAILAEFRPQIVLYQAGVDPHERDRLGKLRLTLAGLKHRDEFVISKCCEAGIPVVTTMGGGYGREILETVEGHCNTVRVALKFFEARSPRLSAPSPNC
jgi:acetoin utilization deacetylase AcuC-like enzyme